KGKMVVLGLVTSKSGTLEEKDALKRRIDEAAKFVDLDQLCLSPQCGFASSEEGNILAEDEQWAKLRRIVGGADEGGGRWPPRSDDDGNDEKGPRLERGNAPIPADNEGS